MKRVYALFFLSILGVLPSCRKAEKVSEPRTEDRKHKHKNHEEEMQAQAEIPLATNDLMVLHEDADLLGFFDEDNLIPDDEYEHMVGVQSLLTDQEFSWVDAAQEIPEDLQTVYFDFDKYSIREDQKDAVHHNASYIKQTFETAQYEGKNPMIVAEGHADLFGNESYNVALSEQRASSVAKELIALGVPKENIKVVGRGQSVPVIVDGKKITGSRDEQWPHRRVECRVITT